jgi:septal ring factor EnvC (AmiA/AmiB activator)
LELQLRGDKAAGWQAISHYFAEYVRGLQDRQFDLCKTAAKHTHEIEQLSAAIENARTLLRLVNDVAANHTKKIKEYQKTKTELNNQGTPAKSAPATEGAQ